MQFSPGARDEADHLAFLDGMRGLAAGYVLLHHAILNPATLAPGLETLCMSIFQYGHYPVDVFIVLSGYCLMLPVLRGTRPFSTRTFLRRRAVRILPTYYLAMLFTLLLIAGPIGALSGTHWDVSLPVTTRDVLLHALLVHDFVTDSSSKISHPFWSVAVEWKIYFLFPVLLVAFRRWGAWRATGLAVLVGYLVWLPMRVFQIGNPWPWGSSTYYLGLFGMGMLAAEIAETARARGRDLRRIASFSLVALSLLCCVLSIVKLPSGRGVPLQLLSLPIGAWTATLFVVLRLQALPWLTRWVSSAPLVQLGKIGYSVYLLHAPIIQLVWLYVVLPANLPAPWRGLLLMSGSFVATLLVAIPFYRVVERPFQELSRRPSAPAPSHEPLPASARVPAASSSTEAAP